MEPHLAKLNKMQLETFDRGANIIDAAILQGFAKASLAVSKAFASLLPSDTSAGISRQAELAAKDIDIQMQSMQATKELILSNERLRRQTEELAIIETRQVLMEQAKDPRVYGKTEAEISQSMQQLIVREAALAIVKTGIFEGAKGNQNLKNYRNSSSDIAQTAARDYTPTSQSLAAINAKEAQANADKLAIKVKAQADQLAIVLAIEKDIRSVEVSRLNLENVTIDSQNRLLPYLSEEVLAKKQAISEEIALNKLVDDRASIVEQILKQQLTINNSSASKEDKAAAENAKIELTNRLIRLGERADNEKIARNIAYTNIVMENAKKEFDARKQVSVTLNSIDVAKQNTKIALQEEYLSILTNMGAVSEEYVASQNTIIALAKEEIRSKAEILAATIAIEAAKFARKQIVESKGEGLNKEDTALQDAQIAAGERLISNEISLSKAKKDSLIVQGKMNEAVAQQNSLMTTLTGLTETLSTLFGEAGNSMGKAMETIASTAIEYSKAQERNVVLQEKMFELQNSEGIDTDKEKLKLQKEITKNETSSYIAVAKGIATVAGAAKNMFKERSAGYKLLSAVEKTAHVATLAMQAKELASTIASIGPSIASGVSKLIAQSGWLGFAGAAAFLALMASLGYGGGGVSMPSGFDAGAQQKVQGTGQTYQDGQLVNRGGGALGDNTAKANSLNNAIDKIEEHSFSTMEYSNDMLDNLKSIKKNTEGLSVMILQSGLNTRGLDVNGEVVTGVGPRKTDMMTKTGDILSGSQLLGDIGLGNTGIGKYLDKLNTSIWGGKTKTEILDLGITFAGSINSLVKSLEDGGKGLNAIYQNVKTTVSGGWFRSDKTSITTQFQELEAIQAEAFGSIFKSIGDTVSSAAEALGKDPKITTSIMDSFEVVFKTSFEGLKPEEVTGALEAEFSNTFNQLAERVLPEFQKFRKPGEEFGDTIVRLARDVQVSALVLEASGMTIGNLTKALKQGESIQEATVRITESLIDLSGGLDKFVSQGQFFNENFLTEAERLAPVQARVTKELSRLQSVADKSGVSIKIAGLNTREGFASVVRGLDLTQTSNQEL
ncbi:MAG: hypothetical protein IPK52_20585 [Chloroflexi bacterium]|nr:hypothetical protein [Chloroflexota bacterium]